jgi:two-component system cell cycle response regulator DivK
MAQGRKTFQGVVLTPCSEGPGSPLGAAIADPRANGILAHGRRTRFIVAYLPPGGSMSQTPDIPRPKTVLLVEDNEDNRFIYATALRYMGYEVIEAVSGTQGIEQARTRLPDLVLMDISIPDVDGWEATIVLKADPLTRAIPIIAVTAHVLPGDERRSMEAGCDGYLAKPVSPATLIAEVDRRLGRIRVGGRIGERELRV